MADRPSFCPDPSCTPLVSYDAKQDATGTCIGKLERPADHGMLKGINDKQWCLMADTLSRLKLNDDDFEFFIYQFALAAKADRRPLSFKFLKTIEREGTQSIRLGDHPDDQP